MIVLKIFAAASILAIPVVAWRLSDGSKKVQHAISVLLLSVWAVAMLAWAN